MVSGWSTGRVASCYADTSDQPQGADDQVRMVAMFFA